ncbi:uncharacterized protein LOC144438926 [Glandiceps talaboti]
MESTPLNILLINCDRLVKLEDIKRDLFSLPSTVVKAGVEYFALKEMDSKADDIKTRQNKPDMAIFVVNANESRLSINEPSAGIGYTKMYTALQHATDDKVIVIIVDDKHYGDKTELISRWAQHKIASQFSREYLSGKKGLVFSWNTKPEIHHKEALLKYMEGAFEGHQICQEMKSAIELDKEKVRVAEVKDVDKPTKPQLDKETRKTKPEPIYEYKDDANVPKSRYSEKTLDMVQEWKSEFKSLIQEVVAILAFLSNGAVDGRFADLLRQKKIQEDQGGSPGWLKSSDSYKNCQENLSMILFITKYKKPNGNITWAPVKKSIDPPIQDDQNLDTKGATYMPKPELENGKDMITQNYTKVAAPFPATGSALGQVSNVTTEEESDPVIKYRRRPDVLEMLRQCVEIFKKFGIEVFAILAFFKDGKPDDKFASMLVEKRIVTQKFTADVCSYIVKSNIFSEFIAFIVLKHGDEKYKIIEENIKDIDKFRDNLGKVSERWFSSYRSPPSLPENITVVKTEVVSSKMSAKSKTMRLRSSSPST